MKNEINAIKTNNKDDLYYKIMIIGASKVGKTQILKRFCKDNFEENYFPTFGMDFRVQKYFFENFTTTVQIIDVSGKNAPPKDLLRPYILDSDCFICVYDISQRDSVVELNSIISDYEKIINNNNNNNDNNNNNNKNQCWYFVGNKNETINRECSNNPADIFEYTPLGTIGFIEVSAKENKFIENMFNNAIFQIRNVKRRIVFDNPLFNYSAKAPIIKDKNEDKQNNDNPEKNSKCIFF